MVVSRTYLDILTLSCALLLAIFVWKTSYFNAINLEAHFGDVMNILLLALQDVPRVAANVCYVRESHLSR